MERSYLTLPIAPRKPVVAAMRAYVVRIIQGLPRRDLIARHYQAVVRHASIFVGATNPSQKGFITANFCAEQQQTLIKGLVEKYRSNGGSTNLISFSPRPPR